MGIIKASNPKGTRDFNSEQVLKRRYITSKIKKCFEQFGFLPIETPSFENLSTLMGKYGKEGDKLIFKILNSGDFLLNVDKETKDSKQILPKISEKALRYDLTIPFARFVVQHRNDLIFPFKRYQIQPVWRADKPQKGRYREFYQCDADVVGSNSLWQEVELVNLYDSVFDLLKLKGVTLRLNNRKIIAGICEKLKIEDRFTNFTALLDKLDKIGLEKILEGFSSLGLASDQILILRDLFNNIRIEKFESFLKNIPIGEKGLEEVKFVLKTIDEIGLKVIKLSFDPTLARGLDYYTGCIFEVAAPESISMGSIGGGGRYDDLTKIFGTEGVSGVGISFGLDRIYLVLEQMNLFPKDIGLTSKALFLNMGKNEVLYAYKALNRLREKGIAVDFYPQADKLKKQFSYADKKSIPYVVIAGTDEIASKKYTLKNMLTGEQTLLTIEQLLEIL